MATAFPDWLNLRRFRWIPVELKSRFTPITGGDVVDSVNAGMSDYWEAVLTTVPLDSTEVRRLEAWASAVGLYGEVLLPHDTRQSAESGVANGLVKGGAQSGRSLLTDGWPADTLILKAGERFQVENGFHMMEQDAMTNGLGEATLNFWPAVRANPADNATVNVTDPVARMLLVARPEIDIVEGGEAAPVTLAFEEVR